MNITASDRSALIRLAAALPQGSAERKTILAGLSSPSISEAAKALSEARKDYTFLSKLTPLGSWYKGDHGKAFKAVNKAATALHNLMKASTEPEDKEFAKNLKEWKDSFSAKQGSSDRKNFLTPWLDAHIGK